MNYLDELEYDITSGNQKLKLFKVESESYKEAGFSYYFEIAPREDQQYSPTKYYPMKSGNILVNVTSISIKTEQRSSSGHENEHDSEKKDINKSICIIGEGELIGTTISIFSEKNIIKNVSVFIYLNSDIDKYDFFPNSSDQMSLAIHLTNESGQIFLEKLNNEKLVNLNIYLGLKDKPDFFSKATFMGNETRHLKYLQHFDYKSPREQFINLDEFHEEELEEFGIFETSNSWKPNMYFAFSFYESVGLMPKAKMKFEIFDNEDDLDEEDETLYPSMDKEDNALNVQQENYTARTEKIIWILAICLVFAIIF